MAETLPSRFNIWQLPSFLLGSVLYCYETYDWLITPSPIPSSYQLILDNSTPCRFPTDLSSSLQVILPDGRKLGYAEYGSPTGKPVFCFHGFPGARTETAMWHHIGKAHNLHLIGIDRPGIGWSSPQPGRRLLDFPKDVQDLADHLGFDEYAIMGASAGGPYALACAYALPREKLKAVSVVIGIGSPDMHGLRNILGWCACAYTPWLVKYFMRKDPAAQLHFSDGERFYIIREQFYRNMHNIPAKDMECFKDNTDVLRLFIERTSKEIFGGESLDGVVEDAVTLGKDWGFKVEDIREDLPIQLWYGNQDEVAPVEHGESYAARLGERAKFRVEDETHGSMIQNWMGEVFEALANTM